MVQGNHEGPKSAKKIYSVSVVHLRNQCCSLIFLDSAAAHAGLSTHLFYCLVMLLICVNKCVLHLAMSILESGQTRKCQMHGCKSYPKAFQGFSLRISVWTNIGPPILNIRLDFDWYNL